MPNNAKIKNWFLSKYLIQSTVRKAWCKDENENVTVKYLIKPWEDQPSLKTRAFSGNEEGASQSSASDSGLQGNVRALPLSTKRVYFLCNLGEVWQDSVTWFPQGC